MKLRHLRKRVQEKHGHPETVSTRDRSIYDHDPFTGELLHRRTFRLSVTAWHRTNWRKK